MSVRFGKRALAAELHRRIRALMRKHQFDTGNGYAQCRGKPIEFAVEYGEYIALCSVMDEYGLWRLVE